MIAANVACCEQMRCKFDSNSSRIFAVRNWWAHVGVGIDDCFAALQAIFDFITRMLQHYFDRNGLATMSFQGAPSTNEALQSHVKEIKKAMESQQFAPFFLKKQPKLNISIQV